MKKEQGRSFVAIMITIGVVSLFLRFGLAKVILWNISQNESQAQDSLKLISVALENYAKAHQGLFPTDFSFLTQAAPLNPAYLDKNYLALSPIKGYNYSCLRLEPAGYSCAAIPEKCQLSANTAYTITTGGLLLTEPCSKQE